MKDYLRQNEMDGIGDMCMIRAIGFAEWVSKMEYYHNDHGSGPTWWYVKVLNEGTPEEDYRPVWVAQNSQELYKEYLKTIEKPRQKWVCNECNFSDYNDSVSEEDLGTWLQCSNCGNDEFHLEKM